MCNILTLPFLTRMRWGIWLKHMDMQDAALMHPNKI